MICKTQGLIYVHLRARRNQRLCQTAYSAQCVFRILRSIYQTRTSSHNQRLTPPYSVISAPLKDGRIRLRVPATMDDELKLELELELLVHEVTAN